jgi:hypothetical protein
MPVLGIVSHFTGVVMHLGFLTLTPEARPLPAGLKGPTVPLAPTFAALIKDAINNKSYPESTYLPKGSRPDFEDVAADGGLLIGFRYGRRLLAGGIQVIVSLRPIYVTSKGEVLGNTLGDPAYAPVDEVKAPPGYAVGSVVWGGSTFCEYVDLTYMKIGDRELLAGDAYKANRVGSQKGNIDVATSFSGDGTPVIGITGRLDTTRLAFGLIFLSDTDAKTASRQGKNTSAR